MKKNDHYFPTMEWIKDPADPSTGNTCGWRRVTYEAGGKQVQGEGHEGIMGSGGGEDVGMEDGVGEGPICVDDE
jgi:hypothetical protein